MSDFLTADALLYQSSTGTSLSNYSDRASGLAGEYAEPAKNIDDILISRISTSNSIKENIVSIGGNTGLSTSCYLSTTTFITSTYGSMVVSTGIATASTLGVVGLGTNEIAYGIIKYDRLKAYNYPKVENLDVSDDYPYSGEGYVTVNSGNSGIGKDSTYEKDGGSDIGYVFSISDVGACTGSSIASNVSNLISQYNSSIVGLSTYTDDVTVIKTYKTEYQFHVWSYNRKIAEDGNRDTSQSGLNQIFSNPAYGGPYSIPAEDVL